MPIRPISKTDNTIIEEIRMRGKKFWAMKERYFGCYSGFDIAKTTKNHVGPIFKRKFAPISGANAPM
jgi:hypothetical protein